MAEGPVIHFYATQLRRALEGQDVDIEFGIKRLKTMESSLH